MAKTTATPAPAKEPKPRAPKVETVSKAEFSELTKTVSSLAESMGGIVELLSKQASEKVKTPAEIAEDKEIVKASPNKYTVIPEWEEIARDVIGDAVDHTEVQYVKGGGTLFTVVIKSDKSNASIEYLERHHMDRRSREIGSEGEAGVRVWCSLIRDNLKRPRPDQG